MGLFDWLGPTSLTKRGGWDTLPPLPASLAEKSVSQPRTINVNGVSSFWAPTSGVSLVTSQPSDSNSAVFACLQAIANAIAEPTLRVYSAAPGGRVELDSTPLAELLDRPNPHMTLATLLAYVVTCLHVEGNAYVRKLRAGNPETGNVVELWPISPTRIEPVSRNGSTDFISYYRYTAADGRTENIPPSNIVHFRYGLDDADHRLGCSPLTRLLREVSSDDQATRYADRLLANLAINGLTLSFDKEAPPITQAQADELKARIQGAYGGDNAGAAAVLSPGAKLDALGFSPEQMDLKVLHRVPEERISAVLGVPAIVAGLGAGLDRSTFSNVREAREMFTEAKLLPLWRALAATITLQLVPDFTNDRRILVDFDTSEVRALADDQNAEALRLKTLVESGIITVDEARAEIGLEPSTEPTAVPAPGPAPASLPAAASRRIVRAVPVTIGGREASRIMIATKAAEDLPGQYDAMRADLLPTWELELVTFLAQQERRILRRLRAGADTADELVTEGEAILLGETLTPLQLRVLGEVSRLVVAEMGIAFTVPNPQVEEMLRRAGVEIVGITETTRAAVQDELVAGQQAGEGVDQIARRLRGLPAFDAPRARVVANTELARTMNESALVSYRQSGVVSAVRVHDGDYDEACAAMDGRIFPLDQAPPVLQHPSCRRAFAPVVASQEAVS